MLGADRLVLLSLSIQVCGQEFIGILDKVKEVAGQRDVHNPTLLAVDGGVNAENSGSSLPPVSMSGCWLCSVQGADPREIIQRMKGSNEKLGELDFKILFGKGKEPPLETERFYYYRQEIHTLAGQLHSITRGEDERAGKREKEISGKMANALR